MILTRFCCSLQKPDKAAAVRSFRKLREKALERKDNETKEKKSEDTSKEIALNNKTKVAKFAAFTLFKSSDSSSLVEHFKWRKIW